MLFFNSHSQQMQTAHAATTIQRFWYAQARWITRKRLQRQMEVRGLNYALLQQAPMAIEDFMKLLVFSPVGCIFGQWLRRILCYVGNHNDAELTRDLMELTMANPHTANQVLNSFFYALYTEYAVDTTLPGAAVLCRSSAVLCTLIDKCMSAESLRSTGTSLVTALSTYLTHYNEWRTTNERIIIRQLIHKAVTRMHQLLEQRLPVIADHTIRLLAMRAFTVTGNKASVGQFLFNTTAMRVMSQTSSNEFWGSHGLHTSRFVHELMIDRDFKLTWENTLPRLAAKYTKPIRSQYEMLMDISATVMWSCRKAESIIELADALHTYSSTTLPSTVDRIVRRVVCILVPRISTSIIQMRNNPPDQLCNEEPLAYLLRCTRTMRNEIANIEIDELRTKHFAELAVYMSQWDGVIPMGNKTRQWVQAAILQCDQIMVKERLAKGDPFALLQLHDNAIINIILPSKDQNMVHCQHIDVSALPEILQFDFNRLQEIRLSLCTDLFKNKILASDITFRSKFQDLVTAGGHHPSSTGITEAANKLRSIIFVSRARHGNTVARIAYEIAKTMQITTTPSTEQAV